MMAVKWVLFLLNFPCLLYSIETDFPLVNQSTIWFNNDMIAKGSTDFVDGSTIRHILLRNPTDAYYPSVGCGFYGNRSTNSFYFAVFAVQALNDSTVVRETPPQILWSANPSNPVQENATFEFTKDGDLVLSDASHKFIWSSNTTALSANQMFVTYFGTLQLAKTQASLEQRLVSSGGPVCYEKNVVSYPLWDSGYLPTDTLIPLASFCSGQSLIARTDNSSSNLTPGLFYLSFENNSLYAFVDGNPPQKYHEFFFQGQGTRLDIYYHSVDLILLMGNMTGNAFMYVSQTKNFQYMRLDPDGHLRVYEWFQGVVSIVDDILTGNLGDCSYPTVCGNYGVCSNGKCSCPVGNDGNSSFFKESNLSPGCVETTQLSCQYSNLHSFIELHDVSYFGFGTDLPNTDIESCKQACLKNCSCKAALFRHKVNSSKGNCSLPSQIYSLMSIPEGLVPYNSTSFLKVQKSLVAQGQSQEKKSKNILLILVTVSIAVTVAVFAIWLGVRCIAKRRSVEKEGKERENSFLQSTNLPRRFLYKGLKSATNDFHKKLGEGGFGSVFEGTLSDGTKVAVKRLDRLGQGKKEFLAEVRTLGSIHHMNLVRLMGFCYEKPNKLLVYKYLSNGSLDKWIFNKNSETALEWKIRKKIIFNIAKGLTYLHEDCEMRIAHLDIKPQNILLDNNFNAKLSDFGLARLIDRNQSQVTTQLRGTRGYMAPEWKSRRITEKVDVYSFGIVVLEVVCGRKNLDFSQQEEDDYLLLPLVKLKAEEDRLSDLVDKCGKDMQSRVEEAVKMIRIAICCLHNDHRRRPAMSTVVKVLEGLMVMEPMSNYDFLTSIVEEAAAEVVIVPSSPHSASVLSGPR